MHTPFPSIRAENVSPALRRRENWLQFVEFGVVGASGYVVNLAVYSLLLEEAGLQYVAAATGSFLVAASWNYCWNRAWTFRADRGSFGTQGMRFFVVSAVVYAANVGLLAALVSSGSGKVVAQGIAIVLVTPLNFLGNKLWSFRREPARQPCDLVDSLSRCRRSTGSHSCSSPRAQRWPRSLPRTGTRTKTSDVRTRHTRR